MASDADRQREYLQQIVQTLVQVRDVLISIRDASGGGGILELLAKLSNLEELTMGVREELDNLIAKVTEIETKADSLIELVNGIAQLLRDNAANPAEIRALADRLEAQAAEVQAAIDANTPPTP